jgi:hypothetical protein
MHTYHVNLGRGLSVVFKVKYLNEIKYVLRPSQLILLYYLKWWPLVSDNIYKNHYFKVVINIGLGSSVGIATDYGLDGPGIESRWERDFQYLSRPALEPTQPPAQ